MTDARPGQKITIIDEQLTLLTAWQDSQRRCWCAICPDGKARDVELGDDGQWYFVK
jgi:hypothetical protein